MCAPEEVLTASDGDCSVSDYSSSSRDDSPRYTPEQVAAAFLDFYQFLAKLHFDPADLRVAPPGGWPNITREACAGWKSDEVIEVLRRLPYFSTGTPKPQVHYKSFLVDYSSMEHSGDFSELNFAQENVEFWDDEAVVDHSYIVAIAQGRESYGRWLFLDVVGGFMHEDLNRADMLPPEDIKDWFQRTEEAYRSLHIIPCVGRITIEADHVPERAAVLGPVTVEEVCAQTGDWKTDLDIHYLRQLYRQHGWPDAFRREDARRAVDDLMRVMGEKRGAWWETDCFH